MNRLFLLLLCLLSQAQGIFAQDFNPEKIVERCMEGVVYIQINGTRYNYNSYSYGREALSLGSGFVIDAKNGYILTNHHVIEGANNNPDNITVEFKGGSSYDCIQIVATDERRDIALIRIKPGKYKELPIAGEEATQASSVAALGNPEGSKFNINTGRISKTDPAQGAVGKLSDIELIKYCFQLDAPINSGNSGGPIVNRNGLVVGMAVAKLREAENMNFAIKARELRNFLMRKGINYKTAPLITDEELKKVAVRELTEEEKAKEKELNMQRMEKQKELEEQEKQAQAARIRLEQQKDSARIAQEKAINEFSAEQQRLLLNQRYEQQRKQEAEEARYSQELQRIRAEQEKALAIKRHDLEMQQLEEQKQRRILQLQQDQLALRQAEDRQRKDRKNYFAQLPQRFSTRIGLGANYRAGSLNNLRQGPHGSQRILPSAELFFGYRLDLEGGSYYSRGTSFGLSQRLLFLSTNNAQGFSQEQNWPLSFQNPIHVGYETEVTVLLREWLRIGSGLGIQELHSEQGLFKKRYSSSTLGFIARFGQIELDFNFHFNAFLDLSQPQLRGSLHLVYHGKWGKW
jgi:hypothetical protein